MRKFEICHALARRRGFTSFLEISTASTGFAFDKVDRTQFGTAHRLAYRTPPDANDGADYTYRTAAPVSYDMTSALIDAAGGSPLYDVVFVDPYHSYHCSLTDLYGAWHLTRPGGVIVVHDCSPYSANISRPTPQEDAWCGLTYQAFIEFTFTKPTLHFYTVDTDFGCGVLFKPPCGRAPSRDGPRLQELQQEWSVVRDDEEARYAHFDRNRVELLNLISLEAFHEREAAPAEPLA
jgi:hypothetical protein